jgi:hypothetical protein
MLQLAQNGRVSKDQSTMMKREQSHLIHRSSAMQSTRLDRSMMVAGLMMAAGLATVF